VLEDWARELGARVVRGQPVVALQRVEDGVVVSVDGTGGRGRHCAGYLVGCDGGRSTVRRLGGFAFPGTEATREMYLADVVGRRIRPRFIGERVPGGMVMSAPLEDGVDRIIVCESGTVPTAEARRAVTFAEVADAWQRLTGESLHGAETRWVSTFTDATRQVTQYRRDRVLLAGDAAHVHLPAGGQGLSVGVQDAANLGWKLAATVRGWAPDGLLDTYHRERHPVGARVLRNTQAQGVLYLSGQEIEPLRSVMAELMAIPDVGRHLSGMVSGLDIRYPVGVSGHPLLGSRMPDLEVVCQDDRRARIADLLHPARGVLVTADRSYEMARRVAAWSGRVDLVAASWVPTDPLGMATTPESVLIRPDGYVAWVAPGCGELHEACDQWFGSAHNTEDMAAEGPTVSQR
jgi:flavin-dependent dehydrogenase